MKEIKNLRLYAKLSPSARYEFKSWNTLWPKLAAGDSTELSIIAASLLYRRTRSRPARDITLRI
jgi:hypothetical protein